MKTEQINLIRNNFERIAPRSEDFATHFYNQLFAQKPTLQLLFPADLTEQKKKLMMTLGVAVKTLNQPEKLIPVLEELGRRHALYGVRDDHYEAVGSALILTLEEKLAEEFTTEAREAWAEMYEIVAETMKRAAHEMSNDFQPKSDLKTNDKSVNPLKLAGHFAILILTLLLFNFTASAQTKSFIYQGHLTGGGTELTG